MTNADIGLTLDEKVRRSLTPLGGPLRIDAFLAVMRRERARLAALQAQKMKAAAPAMDSGAGPEGGAVRPGAAYAAGGRGPATEQGSAMPDEFQGGMPPGEEAPETTDSGQIRAEVDAFMRRDEVREANQKEVSDFLEFMGPTGLQPDDLPE